MVVGLVLELVKLVGGMLLKAYLSQPDVDAIFAPYKDQPVTPELITTIRRQLIARARRGDPLDDPEIRKMLQDGGEDPDSLRTQLG